MRRCGRPLGPLSQAHSTPAGGDFSLEHTDAVRFLRNFGASPLAFRTKLVSVRAAYELLLKLFALPGFHLTWGAVATSRQQHVLSAPRSGHSHVTVLGSRAVADATQRRAVRLGRRPAGWHVRRS